MKVNITFDVPDELRIALTRRLNNLGDNKQATYSQVREWIEDHMQVEYNEVIQEYRKWKGQQ